jgi:hypothetical protein
LARREKMLEGSARKCAKQEWARTNGLARRPQWYITERTFQRFRIDTPPEISTLLHHSACNSVTSPPAEKSKKGFFHTQRRGRRARLAIVCGKCGTDGEGSVHARRVQLVDASTQLTERGELTLEQTRNPNKNRSRRMRRRKQRELQMGRSPTSKPAGVG